MGGWSKSHFKDCLPQIKIRGQAVKWSNALILIVYLELSIVPGRSAVQVQAPALNFCNS